MVGAARPEARTEWDCDTAGVADRGVRDSIGPRRQVPPEPTRRPRRHRPPRVDQPISPRKQRQVGIPRVAEPGQHRREMSLSVMSVIVVSPIRRFAVHGVVGERRPDRNSDTGGPARANPGHVTVDGVRELAASPITQRVACPFD